MPSPNKAMRSTSSKLILLVAALATLKSSENTAKTGLTLSYLTNNSGLQV